MGEFSIPGWAQDLGKGAIVGAASSIVNKITGGSSNPAPPAPSISPPPRPGMSTGAKVALGLGGGVLALLVVRKLTRRGRR